MPNATTAAEAYAQLQASPDKQYLDKQGQRVGTSLMASPEQTMAQLRRSYGEANTAPAYMSAETMTAGRPRNADEAYAQYQQTGQYFDPMDLDTRGIQEGFFKTEADKQNFIKSRFTGAQAGYAPPPSVAALQRPPDTPNPDGSVTRTQTQQPTPSMAALGAAPPDTPNPDGSVTRTQTQQPAPGTTFAGDHVEQAAPAGTPPAAQTGGSVPRATPSGGGPALPATTGYRAPGAPAATKPGEGGAGHTDPYTEQPGSAIGQTRGTSWGGAESWNGSEWRPMDGGNNGGPSGSPAPSPSGPAPSPGGPAPGPAPDPQAAKDAAFARAKDKIGLEARASMTALRDDLAGRGALGGGLEAGGMASLVGGAGGALGDVVSNQAAYDVGTQTDAANRNYAGDLTTRGQNLGVSQSILSLLGSGAY